MKKLLSILVAVVVLGLLIVSPAAPPPQVAVYFTEKVSGFPPHYVDQVSDPFGDPQAVILSLQLPPGTAFLVSATMTADVSVTSTPSPSFSCFLWYGDPATPQKIDQWANVFQIRNDGSQDSRRLAFHGPTVLLSTPETIRLSCAAPAGVYPVTGLGILEAEMTAVTIPTPVRQ